MNTSLQPELYDPAITTGERIYWVLGIFEEDTWYQEVVIER